MLTDKAKEALIQHHLQLILCVLENRSPELPINYSSLKTNHTALLNELKTMSEKMIPSDSIKIRSAVESIELLLIS